VVTAIGWTFVAVSVTGLAIVVSGSTQFKAFRFRAPLPSFSSRGEEAGLPEELDDEMAVAHAARVEPAAADWDLWEEQFYSLEPLVERVKRIREGRR
jgi:hypothetical protein